MDVLRRMGNVQDAHCIGSLVVDQALDSVRSIHHSGHPPGLFELSSMHRRSPAHIPAHRSHESRAAGLELHALSAFQDIHRFYDEHCDICPGLSYQRNHRPIHTDGKPCCLHRGRIERSLEIAGLLVPFM